MANIESSSKSGFSEKEAVSSPHANRETDGNLSFTPEQAIGIFNAITSQDAHIKKAILSGIQDKKLREIAALAIEGSDKNDPNQSEHIIVDFEKPKTPLPWYS